MDSDRTALIENEYKRNLSEQLERLRQEKDALEQRKEKVHELGKFFISTSVKFAFKLLNSIIFLE